MGIDENPLAVVQVYPNPANEVLFVDVKDLEGINSIELLDMNGKQILVQNKIEAGINTLAIEHLDAGIYQVRITQNDYQSTQSLIKL